MIIFDVSLKRWNSPEFLLADMRILDVSPEEVLLFSHSHSLLFFWMWVGDRCGRSSFQQGCQIDERFQSNHGLKAFSFTRFKPGQAISASTTSCFSSSMIKNGQIVQDSIQLFSNCHTVM